jgi:hypothetical protein
MQTSDLGNCRCFHFEYKQAVDGRRIAEAPAISRVLAYGASADKAMAKAEALAMRALAERIQAGDSRPMPINIVLVA